MTIERHVISSNIINHLNNDNFNAAHFIGHGMFDENKEIRYLILIKDNNNEPDYVDHKRLGIIFQNSRSFEKSLGLVILNTCQGAQLGSSRQLDSSKAFTRLASELEKWAFQLL